MNTDKAIEVRDLRKTFKVGFGGLKQVEALRGLNLTVRAGEIYGFLGPNGAGKSTTLKILNRLISASAGEALVFGEPLDSTRARRRVGYLPENPVFYEFLTGWELLSHYGDLLGLARSEARTRAGRLLEEVGLGKAGALQIRRYSKGMVQRLGVAQALLGDPEVVILDEPVSGLDPIGRREMRELLLDLKGRGKTVFFSTHIIPDVELVCDRVGIIIAGRAVREGTVAELLTLEQSATELVVSGLSLEAAAAAFPGCTVREVGSVIAALAPPELDVNPLLTRAIAAGGQVVSVQVQRQALEDLFIREISASATGAADDAPRANIRAGAARS